MSQTCACGETVGLACRCSKGNKHDAGKPRWSLFPRNTLAMVLRVLEAGAKTYGVDNWQQVPSYRTRYYNAAMRHIETWWLGIETRDPETGEHHLAHAVCCLLFLLWFDDGEAP